MELSMVLESQKGRRYSFRAAPSPSEQNEKNKKPGICECFFAQNANFPKKLITGKLKKNLFTGFGYSSLLWNGWALKKRW